MASSDAAQVRLPKRGEPRLLILAEDDDEVRSLLESIFTADGFRVGCARDGRELVRILERARDSGRLPDVIVTDHRMPHFTGLEVAQALRENDWPVPVIVMTAFARDITTSAASVADVVFLKPFDADDLRTAVMYCTGKSSAAYSRRTGSSPDAAGISDERQADPK